MIVAFKNIVPKEALDFIKNKGLRPGFSYLDVMREEHGYAFTVAKAMQIDVLESIKAEIETVISEGKTFEMFKKDLTPTLQKLGWWGQKEMKDPLTGEIKKVQLGSPRRLRTIYQVNTRQARSAGQWQRGQRTKKALPYYQYALGPSLHHRHQHEAWAGTILPVDDPWWDTHMPINGWGCKCRVRQISKWEMDKNGLRLSNPPPVKKKEWVNKRTGEVMYVPEGIDPGFDYNPGKTRKENLDRFMQQKLKAADPMIREVAKKDLAEYARSQRADV